MNALRNFIGRCFATPRRSLVTILMIIVLWGSLNPKNASYIVATLLNGFWEAFGALICLIGLCYFLWTKVLFKKSAPANKKKK